MVDGGHFHSQGDGVLVLAVHRAIVLTQREEEEEGVGGGTNVHNLGSETPPPPPPPVLYLCRGGGLQSVQAKGSAERSLVEIGQVAGLGGRGRGGVSQPLRRVQNREISRKNGFNAHYLLGIFEAIHRRGGVKQEQQNKKIL